MQTEQPLGLAQGAPGTAPGGHVALSPEQCHTLEQRTHEPDAGLHSTTVPSPRAVLSLPGSPSMSEPPSVPVLLSPPEPRELPPSAPPATISFPEQAARREQ